MTMRDLWRRRRIVVAETLIVVLLTAAAVFRLGMASLPANAHGRAVAPGIASATCSPLSRGPWSVVPTPNVVNGVLRATGAHSSSDVWAVGFAYDTTLGANQTLIEHWNGSAWSIIPSPNQDSTDNQLYGVAALASNDVWAVGYFGSNSTNAWQTLTEHWNGSQWSIIPSPDVAGSGYNFLAGVSAVSAKDVWAVGAYLDGTALYDRTLIEHWNGTQWSIVPSTNPGAYPNDLLGIAAISTDDVWAVGYYDDVNSFVGTLIEHWDGTTWTAVPNPPMGILYSVAAVSTSDIWAVGQDVFNHALIVHWNGKSWSISPIQSVAQSILSAVVVISSSDVWAVGGPNGYGAPVLAEHWNGSQWSLVPIVGASSLNGLAAISANDVWVVGTAASGSTLAEHYRTIAMGAPGPVSRAITSRHSGGAILCP